ncbi:MAG: DUF262 domain-containing protein [Bacteroidales bacterium]|nr:DUF262 domain-containing protein [Bacteroidales bacterium]
MKAESPSITGVFQRTTILRIPFFQRQYVWGQKEWDRFLMDMDSLIGARTKYFLGSLILKEEETTEEEEMYGVSNKFSVVDGQQRLTTLSLYLKALHSLIADANTRADFDTTFFIRNDQKTPVLTHSINDRPAYQAVMWGNPLGVYEDNRIVQAYHYMYEELQKKDNKRELLNAVYARIKFVTIILDSQDDEQQIFDTINSLGVDLTIDELMKNFLYEINDEDAYRHNWKPAFDDNEVRKFWGTDDAARKQASTDENKTITNFFFDFVRIKMWDYRYQNKFDRKVLAQKNHIFNSCKAFVEVFHANKQELANEIIGYSKLYHKYFDKKNLEIRIPSAPCIERVACIAMASVPSITPYLLYVLKNVPDLSERNKIFGYIEKYLVRRMICFPADQNKNYVEFFAETLTGNRLDTYDKLKLYIERIDDDKNQRMPSDNEIKLNIHQRTYGSDETLPRLFFYLYETANNYKSDTGGFNYFMAETMIPKRTKANEVNYPPHADDTLEQQRQTRIKTLGNYVLLHQPYYPNITDEEVKKDERKKFEKEVKSHSNETWATKQQSLVASSQNVVCSNWLTNMRTWGETEIDVRNRGLVQLIGQIWPLD